MSDTISVIFVISLIAAWFTHVLFCLSSAAWGFLIAGALFFPIGIIHGVMIWFQ